ncbi:MAG: head-tail connector protein [Planctomycetota bacterium]
MAYCTVADVKDYLDIEGAGDDALLNDLIERAQKAIDSHTQRIFENPGAAATRLFTVGVDTEGLTLLFNDDICSITAVETDADGSSPRTILPADYATIPRNSTPYYGIKILSSSGEYWDYTDDPENGIKITGIWAYSATAPNDIVQACARWAAYMYRQRDAQVFDVTAIPSAGVIQIPKGIPADVKILLDPYVRPRL